ncbi:MAG TPA: hypothetical protein VIY48_22020 [Candidatus Paceibacterota bacterium]
MAITKIGFTGTQRGMTEEQKKSFRDYILGYNPWQAEFHHGDCIGADADAHAIVSEYGLPTVIYPAWDDAKRAYCAGTIIHERNTPLVRNVLIVVHTDFLIACPKGFEEELRSGTWHTIRQAKKRNRKVFLIYPDGKSEVIPAR